MKKCDKMHLVYVGGNIGIKDTAMGIHARNIARLFSDIGYKISFVCQSTPSEDKRFKNEGKYTYYYTPKYIDIPKLRTIETVIEEFTYIKLFSLFKKVIKDRKPDLVVFYGTSGEKKIISYCRNNNIPIYVDETDWFELDDREGFIFNKIYRNFRENYNIEKLNLKANGVIAISNYFFNYYKKRNQNCIWIPPIFKVGEFKDKQVISPIRLIYAGSLAGNKDIILPVVQLLLSKFNTNQIQYRLDLIGISEEDLEEKIGENNWKEKGIFAWGRLTHEETVNKIEEADFSILLRQNKRYAQAGFSTKFAESLTQSVPVICTQIGGSDCLIRNYKNGVLIEDNEIETIEQTLNHILLLSHEEIRNMRIEAYKTAKEFFDYRVYKTVLSDFIENTKISNI